MLTFKQVGKTNTDVTLKLAIQTALEREMNLVVATTKGDTALRAAEPAQGMGWSRSAVRMEQRQWMKTAFQTKFVTGCISKV